MKSLLLFVAFVVAESSWAESVCGGSQIYCTDWSDHNDPRHVPVGGKAWPERHCPHGCPAGTDQHWCDDHDPIGGGSGYMVCAPWTDADTHSPEPVLEVLPDPATQIANVLPLLSEVLPGPATQIASVLPSLFASATTLKLTWSDCGQGAHAKITSFTPDTLETGKTTTMTGIGDLDKDVTSASFDLEMKTALKTVSCKGDASQSKTCALPLGVGSLTFDALTFPLKKGSVPISVDLKLSALLPGSLAHTETKVTSTGANGEQLFCIEIKSAPAEVPVLEVLPDPATQIANVLPLLSEVLPGPATQIANVLPSLSASATTLKLTWSDCGQGAHAKITGFTPDTLETGKTTTMTGTGDLDQDVTSASFDLEMKTALKTVSCKGDASQSKTCPLPLGVGSLTFDALNFPLKKGSVPISVDLKLSALLPGLLTHTETKVTSTGANGEQLFCIEIKSAPAEVPVLEQEMAGSTADVSIEEMGENTAHGACSAADKEHLSDPNTVGKKQDACGHSAYSIIHGMDENKFVSCVKKDLKISDGCAKCYFGAADYGAKHCKMKCLSGWCKKGCLDCTTPYMSSLKKCTGFTPKPAKPCMSEALSNSTAEVPVLAIHPEIQI